jgi:hypothetical protein
MEKQVSENGVAWTLFRASKCPYLDRLLEIYKEDRMHAKVIFEANKNKYSYTSTRDVLFEFPNGDFKIARMTRKFGMSITNIIYHRESTDWAISYKKATKKLYYIGGVGRKGQVTQCTFNTLLRIMPTTNNVIPSDYPAYKYLASKFGWLRNIGEDSRLHTLSFNVIMSKKLFNGKKALAHIYGVPYPVADVLSKNKSGYTPWDYLKMWKQMRRHLINIDNLKEEILGSNYFIDACRIGGQLGHKVNCSWSLRRLKEEHDKWSKELDAIVMKYEPVIDLNIAQVYRDFAEFSGYPLLLTNHALINEGRLMRHCVGSYTSNVNAGNSGIMRVEGHTLEVGYRNSWVDGKYTPTKKLVYNQLKGVSNANAPKDLDDGVKMMIDAFNEFKGKYQYPEHVNTSNHIDDGGIFGGIRMVEVAGDELPF